MDNKLAEPARIFRAGFSFVCLARTLELVLMRGDWRSVCNDLCCRSNGNTVNRFLLPLPRHIARENSKACIFWLIMLKYNKLTVHCNNLRPQSQC